MYELKLKTAGLCRGIKLKCFLLRLAFFAVFAFSALCFLTGAASFIYGENAAYGGFFSVFGYSPDKTAAGIFTAALFISGAFLAVCAASLAFALKAVFFYAADKNQSRPSSFISFSSGVRYLRYKTLSAVKKGTLFIRFTLPFFIQLLLAAVLVNSFGADKFSLIICAAVLVFSLVFSLFCFFVWARRYDSGVYLMYLNRMLSPVNALESSEEKTAGKLLPLAVYKLSLLPKRAACLFFLSSLRAVPFTGVFNALVCEKLYGENKKNVKVPAVTFYINKKTRMEEAGSRE